MVVSAVVMVLMAAVTVLMVTMWPISNLCFGFISMQIPKFFTTLGLHNRLMRMAMP